MLMGFGLRVGKKTKSFYAQKRIKGKNKRITIGIYGQITLDQARREAQRLLGIMATGKDPKELEKEQKVDKITFDEVIILMTGDSFCKQILLGRWSDPFIDMGSGKC